MRCLLLRDLYVRWTLRSVRAIMIGFALLVVAGSTAACDGGSSGAGHTKALSGYGWGTDAFGQLGASTNGELRSPTPVPLPAGTKAVALGRDFSLALAGGHVYAWGEGSNGQLGNGDHRIRTAPTVVRRLDDVIAIAAGGQFGLAITSHGDLYGWGANDDGELGTGTTKSSALAVKVQLPKNVNVAQVAAGSAHVVALTDGGALYAWGRGGSGELGTGSTKGSAVPKKVGLPGGMKVKLVAVGESHSVAVTTDHHLLGWGANTDGRLGLGKRDVVRRPVQIPSAGHKVEQVAAEAAGTLVRTSDGVVLATGRNEKGQLGDGTFTGRTRFVRVRLPATFRPSRIAAGPLRAYALSHDGTVIAAWGDGAGGRLGTPASQALATPTLMPEPFTPGIPARRAEDEKPRFRDVAVGPSATIALAEQGALARLVALRPPYMVPAGAPATIAVRAYDAAGNDLGQPDGVTVTMAGGSCDGVTCTGRSPGRRSVAVAVPGHKATTVLQILPAALARRSPAAGGSSTPPAAHAHAPSAAGEKASSNTPWLAAAAAGLLILLAVAAVLIRRRIHEGARSS